MPHTHDKPVMVKCRSCSRPMDSPIFCQSCRTLYPEDTSEDHFQLFGLPRQYDVDPDELHQRFLAISRNIHPDYFNAQAVEMQGLALRLSARVNEAYATLRDPILRAEYMLESAGGPSAAADKRAPGEMLAQVMMWREDMEDAKAGGDANALAAKRSEIQTRRAEAMAEVAALCSRLDDAGADVRQSLRLQLNAVKYLDALLAEL